MSRLRVNKLTNKDNNGAPEFVHGVTISGVATATKFKGDGSELTSVPSSFTVLDSGVPSGTIDSLNFGSGMSIDSTLNGVATISVDTSNLAPLSGAAFVGDISAYNITANGTITSVGDVNAVNVTASGAITSTGNVNAVNVTTSGAITSAGNVDAATVTTSGAITSADNVNAVNLTATGNVSAVNVTASGTITAAGYSFSNLTEL